MKRILAWGGVMTVLTLAPLAVFSQAQSPAEQLAAASALFDAKKYDQAAAKLDVFLIGNPKHPKAGAAALVLAQSRAQLKQWDKASAAYEKAVESKDAAIVPQAQLGLGEAAFFAKQYDKASNALTEALKTRWSKDQASRAWYLLGESQFQAGRMDKAEEAFGRVVTEFGNSDSAEDANFRWAQTALRQDKLDEARNRFRRFINRFDDSADKPQAFLLLGQLELKAKRLPEARQAFEAALEEEAAQQNASFGRAAEDGLIQVLLAQKDDQAAAPRLESAVAKLPMGDPQRFRAALALGHARYRLKEFGKASEAYIIAAKSAELKVAEEGAWWQANAVAADNKTQNAATLYAAFAEKYPKSSNAAKALLRAGENFETAKLSDQSAQAYRNLIAKFPQSPEAAEARKAAANATANLTDPDKILAAVKTAAPADKAKGMVRAARLYLSAEKTDKAIPVLDEVILAKPDTATLAEAYFLLGVAHDAKDKNQPAAAAFANALKLGQNAEWTPTATLRVSYLSLALKKPADAEKYAGDALKLTLDKTQKEQARLALMQAQADQKKWDAAIATAKSIQDEEPSEDANVNALYVQATAEEARGKADDALALWEKLANDYGKTDYGAEALIRVGDNLMKAEKWEDARARYNQLVQNNAASPFAAEARFKIGSTLYNEDKFTEAAQQFEGVIANKKAGSYLAEALYWAGMAQDKAGNKDTAITYLTRLTTEFPKHTRAEKAKIRLAALKATKS